MAHMNKTTRTISIAALAIIILTITLHFDTNILRTYRSFNLPVWTSTLEDITSAQLFTGILVAGGVLMLFSGRKWTHHAMTCMITQFIVVHVLKHLIGRVRPCHSGGAWLITGPSWDHVAYPSGHTAAMMTMALILNRRYPKLRLIWFTLPLIIAWSRLHADAHFAADLLAGALVGFAVESIVWSYRNRKKSSTENNTRREHHTIRQVASSSFLWTSVILLPIMLITLATPNGKPSNPEMTPQEARQIVADLYQQILNREPDQHGFEAHTQQFIKRPITVCTLRSMALCSEFTQSMRPLSTNDRTTEIYKRLLDRPPTAQELTHIQTLMADEKHLSHAIRTLILRLIISKEYQQRYGCFLIRTPTVRERH